MAPLCLGFRRVNMGRRYCPSSDLGEWHAEAKTNSVIQNFVVKTLCKIEQNGSNLLIKAPVTHRALREIHSLFPVKCSMLLHCHVERSLGSAVTLD